MTLATSVIFFNTPMPSKTMFFLNYSNSLMYLKSKAFRNVFTEFTRKKMGIYTNDYLSNAVVRQHMSVC